MVKKVDIHITLDDRRQDAKNGRKAKGSTWGKGKKAAKKGKKRNVTRADRRQDAKNGRKAKGSTWHRHR